MSDLRPLIDILELRQILSKKDLLILDTRGSLRESGSGKSLFEDSHIPGAQWIDFVEDIAGERTEQNGRTPIANREKLTRTLCSFGLRHHSRVVVYDEGELHLAARVWFTLRWMGLADVQVLTGGFAAWMKAGLPLQFETQKTSMGDFKPGSPLERVVTTAEVETILATQSHLLVDARSTKTYTGETTLDTKYGHIKGSISSPARLNFDAKGNWLEMDTIRKRFLALSGGHPERIVHTCGSGVAACLNHLAMRAAGLEDGGVYIGSFSEWIRDPKHAIATGSNA